MLKLVLLGILAIVIVFVGFIATRPAHFSFTESTLIKATPEKIYPYISQLKLGGQWLPYEKRDPSQKQAFSGNDGAPGSKMVFDGKQSGTGSVEILSLVPNQEVKIQLLMNRPMKADNLITYKLEPVGAETRFTWSMEGENGYLGKLFSFIMSCTGMMTKDMNEGFDNLRKIVE